MGLGSCHQRTATSSWSRVAARSTDVPRSRVHDAGAAHRGVRRAGPDATASGGPGWRRRRAARRANCPGAGALRGPVAPTCWWCETSRQRRCCNELARSPSSGCCRSCVVRVAVDPSRPLRGMESWSSWTQVAVSTPVFAELTAAIVMTPSMGVSVQPWRQREVASAALLAAMLPAPVLCCPHCARSTPPCRRSPAFEVVVGMHEHALMAAAAAGTPSVAVGRAHSLAAIAGRLGHDLVDRPIGARRLADVLERARVAAIAGGGPPRAGVGRRLDGAASVVGGPR